MQAGDLLAGLTIVCIADDIAGIEPLVHDLRAAGAVVVVVRTAAVALAFSDRYPVHVILVDLRDPDWWLTPEIRALRSLSRAPVYALTEPDETIDPTAELAGHFVKPVSVEAAVATLSTVRRRSR